MIDVTKFKPCGDKLLIKPDPVDEKTKGGIIKPDPTIVELQSGTIVLHSDGYYGDAGFWVDMTKQIKVGDKVIFQHGVHAPVEHQREYSYIQMAGILGREYREGM